MKITRNFDRGIIARAVEKEMPLAREERWPEHVLKEKFEEVFNCKVIYSDIDNPLDIYKHSSWLDEIVFNTPEDEVMFLLRFA